MIFPLFLFLILCLLSVYINKKQTFLNRFQFPFCSLLLTYHLKLLSVSTLNIHLQLSLSTLNILLLAFFQLSPLFLFISPPNKTTHKQMNKNNKLS